jgi:hypothetical protein
VGEELTRFDISKSHKSCLTPTQPKKSDAIPSPKMIRSHKNAIAACWEKERESYPAAFVEEIRYSLTGYGDVEFNSENAVVCLEKRCEFLIEGRGYAPWEKN